MSKKRNLSKDPRNVARREKYEYALNVLGVPKEEAGKMRSWGWDRIRRESDAQTPTHIARQQIEFLQRRTEGKTRREEANQKYWLLRDAGIPDKQAKSYQWKSDEFVASILDFKRSIDIPTISLPDPERSAPFQAPESWDYIPFDKTYTRKFAYMVQFEYVDRNTGEIKTKWYTTISDEELSFDKLQNIAEGWTDEYQITEPAIIQVIPRRSGLPGGVW